MRWIRRNAAATFWLAALTVFSGTFLVGSAQAVPVETYNLNNNGSGGTTIAGTVTVTWIDLNDVSVAVTLAPNLLINTGGPHTPFAFNLTSALATALNTAGGNAIKVTAPVTTLACSPRPHRALNPFTGRVRRPRLGH